MNYFLAKTDPQTYSIQDLEKDKKTVWDGVHSYAALGYIKKMEIGDMILIYHSQKDPSIVGLAEVISTPRKDKGERESWVVDVKYLKTFDNPISLAEIKQSNKFNSWSLVREGRLSTMSVPKEFIDWSKKRLEL